MVTAPAGPGLSATVAPIAVTAPPDSTPQAQSKVQFHEIYQNIPASKDGETEPDAKEGGSGSKDGGPKRQVRDNGNDKTAMVPSLLSGNPLARTPLVLAVPSLGPEGDGPKDGLQSESQTDVSSKPDLGTHAGLFHNFNPLPAAPVNAALPAASSIAFSIRLKPEAPPATTQVTPQPAKPSAQPLREPAHPSAQTIAPPTTEPEPVNALKAVSHIDAASAREFSASPAAMEVRPMTSVSEAPEVLHATPVNAIHEVQAILPEAPKVTPNAEILLHLPGKDQSVAAVRLVDRSGTVNVSVHASDPELRNTLRSNLGELASQLNGQGFRTEVIKPTVVAAHADNAQDSRHDGQRSAGNQQQSTHGDRQPQRDRRTNSSRWLEELEQETSSEPSTSGGTN